MSDFTLAGLHEIQPGHSCVLSSKLHAAEVVGLTGY